MRSRFGRNALCVVVGGLMFLTAFARPVLQPEVRDYRETGGTFRTADLPVFHQDQAQCAIAADETMAGGAKSVWDGASDEAKGVYIAIAASPLGEKLATDFALDVPTREQGYAIAAADGRVAIVGRDAAGALYGAVTFAQMSAGGTVASATVRDWPDLRIRGAASLGRGIAFLASGERTRDGKLAAYKAGIDFLLRHKLNAFCDFFNISTRADEKTFAFYREVMAYAQDRGIHPIDYTSTAIYYNYHKPEAVKFTEWPCVKTHEGWGEDKYFCWSDDAATEAAAEYMADYYAKLGATKGIVVVHPVDGGSWPDPEMWSHRCPRCREKWGDGERWKASIRQFDIWTRVFRRRLPEATIGSCIYPYTFGALLQPEEKRTAKWKESMPEYWQKLSAGLSDDGFFFSSWIAAGQVMSEFRKLVPRRAVHFSDTYPQSSGVFSTYHRKLGAAYEEGLEDMFWCQGKDTRAYWESLFLVAEYAWNTKAPGADPFAGGTYYDPLVDHTGPEPVMKDVLPRICRTFWGDELAPFMVRFLSSGVMPGYIANPAGSVRYWNSTRRDPLFDPNVKKDAVVTVGQRLPYIVDTPDFMAGQVAAAEKACAALMEAKGHLGGLDRFRRKHFMRYAKLAPQWFATVRARLAVRRGNELAAAGRNAEAVRTLERGVAQLKEDFDFADANLAELKDEPVALDYTIPWRTKRADMETLLDDAIASARVVLKPRRPGRFIRVGITTGASAKGTKEFLDGFVNVQAEIVKDVSLVTLDRFDCVFVSARAYEKDSFFRNLKAYAEKGGGGVYLEGYLCGHERFDRTTPFPDVVRTSPGREDNFGRLLKTADGEARKTLYIDYFVLEPGAKGEVRGTSPDGKPVCVRGPAGLGKAYFNGTFNIGSVNGTWSEESVKLYGFNAAIVREAVEYFTGVKLVEKEAR